jgi:hypothetical protein
MLSNAIEVKKRTVKNNRGLVIGIDPDLVKSGVAVSFNGSLSQLYALSFPELLEFAKSKYAEHGERVEFIVEEVEADKTTYNRKKTNEHQMRKIAQNVGQVKGVKRVLVECLQHEGIAVRLVKPLKGVYKKKAKADAKFFNQLTGWTGSSNEDKRDAGLLALYG